jgi:hypothetical protein
MKKIRTKLVTLAFVAIAALAVSCSQPLDPPVSPAAAGTGQVMLTVSNGIGGSVETAGTAVRTILPAGDSYFSRYELVLNRTGGNGSDDFTVDHADGLNNEGESLILKTGDWTVTVRAYRTYQISNTEQEYLAARGSKPFTINPGQITPVQVELAPIPVGTDASRGIFTYQVSFPTGAGGTLTLGTYTADLPDSGNVASVEIDPGYYDLFISLTNVEGLSAWVSEEVHIYSGLESRAEFDFSTEDFTAVVYLMGTAALPASLGWENIERGTVTAYSNADYTGQLGSSPAGASWITGVPASSAGSPIYLKAEVYGPGGRLYTAIGDSGGPLGETGVRGIVLNLADSTPPVEAGGFAGLPGDGETALFWTDPTDVDLSHIEITWAPGGTDAVTVAKGTQTYTVTGLTNGVSYAFTAKSVDTEGNKSTGITKTLMPPGLNNIADTAAYLAVVPGGASANDPVPLPLSINLADTGGNGWNNLLGAIGVAEKYVALDLSGSAIQGTEFDPGIAGNTGKSRIVSLVLPDATLSIKAGNGNNPTFRYFNNLESVSGGNVVTIGDRAFSYCYALAEVNLPEAVTIGQSAFLGCTALVEVDFPEATSIGSQAFSGCPALVEMNFPKVETIGGVAFSACITLVEVNLPKAVTIGDNAFTGCTALVEVNLPKVETIGNYAFGDCTALEIVDCPAAISIGSYAFDDCIALEEVTFGITSISSNSNIFSSSYKTTLKKVNLPKAVTIGDNAFYECTALIEVDFPEAQTIGKGAFTGCTALETVNLPAATSIGQPAFLNTGGTTALTITLPIAAPSLANTAYTSETYSKTVTIKTPSGRTGYDSTWESRFKYTFGNNAAITLIFEGGPKDVSGFAGVPGDGKATLFWTDPADVNLSHIEITWAPGGSDEVSIGTQTYTVTGLTNEVSYAFTVKAVDTEGNKSGGITRTLVPPGFNNIANVAVYLAAVPGGTSAANPVPLPVSINLADTGGNGWNNLLAAISAREKYVMLDLSGSTMQGTEFDPGTGSTGKDRIVSLVLPDAVLSIKAGTSDSYNNPTFRYFNNLESVSGSNVVTIGDYYAFYKCTTLTTVNFPKAETIGGYAFAGCTALETIDFPGARSIGSAAFASCIALVEVNLPEATAIGIDAFNGCTALVEVNLLEVTSIGEYAFYYCPALESVSLPNAASIGSGAFGNTGSTALTITLGNTIPTLGISMFDVVSSAKTVTVKVPSSATGYGTSPANTTTDNWGNAFRGKGWDGTSYLTGSVNSFITLTIEKVTT